jgi:hypothetical protein
MSNIEIKKDIAPVPLSEWGTGDQVLGQDVLLSKILPMQGMSQMVTDMKAQVGEFRDSVSGVRMGSIVEPIELIPFHLEKHWDILTEAVEGQSKQYKYTRSEPLIENPIDKGYNDNLPWQDIENGANIKRIRRMNYYVMLPEEIKTGTAIPYVFSFKSTSYREGKKMFTQMYVRSQRARLSPAAFTFKIGGIKAKNPAGQTYIVPTVELGRRTTAEEEVECFEWYKVIRGKKPGTTVKVDDSDLSNAEMSQADDSGVGEF